MRAAEGARLLAMARGHIDEIERLAEAARGCAATQPQALRQRLTEQLALLLEESAGVSEDRLAQALAMLAGKAEVREELDRLPAPVTTTSAVQGSSGTRRSDLGGRSVIKK